MSSDEWAVLRRHFERGEEHYLHSLVKRLMRGEEVSQTEIAYYRGFHEGARMVLSYPKVALANLEKAAAKGYAAHLEREEIERFESQSPHL